MAAADSRVSAMQSRARAGAECLLSADHVVLASHIDADGLTSAAVAATALERADISFETVFEKQLDAASIAGIAARPADTVLFTDFGSGQLDIICEHELAGDFTPVVADHHQPADADTEFHINPVLAGIDGAAELSGAGVAYILARELAAVADGNHREENRDLAALAVVGAVGDMQASSGELHGVNSEIVQEGIDAGVLEETRDLAIYGKQTRPLSKLLEYASDVRIPGITNDERGAVSFLEELDIECRTDGEWKRWVDLTDAERQTVASALVRRAVDRGVPAFKIEQLVGTTYILSAEPEGTELRDASEFSTLLNATARYERADVGLAVCLGNRQEALERARELLRNHRRNLSEGIDWVETRGVSTEANLQWFDAGTEIRETIVGIVAGMAMGVDTVESDRPIVAFARKNDGETKVSSRGTAGLVAQGLDLSVVMKEAAQAVDGEGGGHDIAAGGTIPVGTEQTFIDRADDIIGRQLN